MAGIYIHIPFCKSRCQYCDFYSTTLLGRRDAYVEALKRELTLRKGDFAHRLSETGEQLETVYFGGGTPSSLCESQIIELLDAVRSSFSTDYLKEITMEANPGDLSEEMLRTLHQGGVNRLSIGIQSLTDSLLRRIGRRHTAEQAMESVKMAQRAGFGNISIDLMYGLPGQTMDDWQSDIEKAISLGVQHISAYCLTYEEGTPLYRSLVAGEVEELDDDLLNRMQDYLEEELQKNGINRYEVSNYAIDGFESKHNGSYWTGAPYMGLGAGAHSYDGHLLRQWNPDDLEAYISNIGEGRLALESEILSDTDRFNESVMLGLRTVNGINLAAYSEDDREHILQKSARFLAEGHVERGRSRLRATHAGMRILNTIIEELMKE